jgi:hypothetical protein
VRQQGFLLQLQLQLWLQLPTPAAAAAVAASAAYSQTAYSVVCWAAHLQQRPLLRLQQQMLAACHLQAPASEVAVEAGQTAAAGVSVPSMPAGAAAAQSVRRETSRSVLGPAHLSRLFLATSLKLIAYELQ